MCLSLDAHACVALRDLLVEECRWLSLGLIWAALSVFVSRRRFIKVPNGIVPTVVRHCHVLDLYIFVQGGQSAGSAGHVQDHPGCLPPRDLRSYEGQTVPFQILSMEGCWGYCRPFVLPIAHGLNGGLLKHIPKQPVHLSCNNHLLSISLKCMLGCIRLEAARYAFGRWLRRRLLKAVLWPCTASLARTGAPSMQCVMLKTSCWQLSGMEPPFDLRASCTLVKV